MAGRGEKFGPQTFLANLVPGHRVQKVGEGGAGGSGPGESDRHHLVHQLGLVQPATQKPVDVHRGRSGHETLSGVLGSLVGLKPLDQRARHLLPQVPAAVRPADEPGKVTAHTALDDGKRGANLDRHGARVHGSEVREGVPRGAVAVVSVEGALEDDLETEKAVEEENVGRAVFRGDDAPDQHVGLFGDETLILEDRLLAENGILELASSRVCFLAVKGENVARPVVGQFCVLVEMDRLVAGLLAVDGPVRRPVRDGNLIGSDANDRPVLVVQAA